MKGERLNVKVVLLGDPGVGKTSLVVRYVLNNFNERYLKTLGTRVYKKEVSVVKGDSKWFVKLIIWDTLGQKGFKHIQKSALKGSQGALVVCDITDKQTVNNIKYWVRFLFDVCGPMPVVLIANKSDLEETNDTFREEFLAVGEQLQMPTYITSAKSGSMVNEIFQAIGSDIVKRELGQSEDPPDLANILPAHHAKKEESINGGMASLTTLEDAIIDLFCESCGDQEFAMPIVRRQVSSLGIDFTSPTLDDIYKLCNRLIDITTQLKGEEGARKLKRDINGCIRRYKREQIDM